MTLEYVTKYTIVKRKSKNTENLEKENSTSFNVLFTFSYKSIGNKKGILDLIIEKLCRFLSFLTNKD